MNDSLAAVVEIMSEQDVADVIKWRVQTTLWPIFARIETGRFVATGVLALNGADAVTQAISLATGCPAKSIQLKAAAKPFLGGPDAPFRYDKTLTCDDSLAVRLWNAHYRPLNAQISAKVGFDGRYAFEDRLKAVLRSAVGDPLGFEHYDGLSFVPTNPPGESLLTAMYYYLAYACVGDLTAMGRFEPLIRLMTHVIPVGRLAAAPECWVCALLPSARAD